jgi:predicted MFS family arabinose efflux permease
LSSSPEGTGAGAGLSTRAQERTAVAALALAAFALNLNTNVIGALLPHLPAELVQPGRGDRTLIAAAALASAVAALLAGPIADRIGRRPLLVAGMIAFALASALHCVAGSYGVLLAARVLSGAAVGFAYAPASALVAEIVPYERRGAAMGVFSAGMFLALPVGLPLAWWCGARLGAWQAIFALQAVVAVTGAVLAWRSVPALPTPGTWVDPRDVLRQVPVLAALLAVMLHVGSFFTTVQLSGRWLDAMNLVPKQDQGWLWVVLGLAAVLGSLGLGRAADRIGKRNFVLMTSIVLVMCFTLLVRVETLAGLLPLGLLLAVTAAARTGPLQALTSSLVPSYQFGTLMGVRAFAQQFGVFAFAQFVPGEGQYGFATVLYAAAACQIGSYLAIRLGVREVRS